MTRSLIENYGKNNASVRTSLHLSKDIVKVRKERKKKKKLEEKQREIAFDGKFTLKMFVSETVRTQNDDKILHL